ncbi:hypothetical protein ACOME3_000932 [Neoechinorhynchus agilis]
MRRRKPRRRDELRSNLKKISEWMLGTKRSPFSVLYSNLFKTIRVVLRNASTVHSVCIGRLIAFDRHMNLIMIDVLETFSSNFLSFFKPLRDNARSCIVDAKKEARRAIESNEDHDFEAAYERMKRGDAPVVSSTKPVPVEVNQRTIYEASLRVNVGKRFKEDGYVVCNNPGSRCRNNYFMERYIDQLFIMGNQVVAINPCEST